MLKRINVEDLVLGMYVKEFCGSWLDHPFWRSSFLLSDESDLRKIRASKIKVVWIDGDRGIGVAPVDFVAPVAVAASPVEDALKEIPTQSTKLDQVEASIEVIRAGRIRAHSKAAVKSMFQDARLGKAVNVSGA